MDLFSFLKNYKEPGRALSYGDILDNTTMLDSLSNTEKYIMEQIKLSDRRRLINS